MAIQSMTTITVTATYTLLDGTPCSGKVYFESRQVIVGPEGVVEPMTFVAELDANGAISIDLPATDDPDYEPTGWAYHVSEETTGRNRPTFNLAVPHDGGSIDLKDVAVPGPTEDLRTADFTLLSTFNAHQGRHGPGGADEVTEFARGDGGLQVGGLAKIKNLDPLTLEHLPSDTYGKRWTTEIGDFTGDLGQRIQAAHDALPAAGGTIDARYLGGAATTTSTAITLTKPCQILFGIYSFNCVGIAVNINGCGIEGIGIRLSEVRSTSTDVLTFDEASRLSCREISFRSNNGGGHVVNDKGSTSFMKWDKVHLLQDNDGFSCYYLDDEAAADRSGVFIDNHFTNVHTFHTLTATVATWHLRGEAVNRNRWEHSRPTYSGNYTWLIETTAAGAYASENTIVGVTAEITTGGLIRLLGCEGTRLADIGIYDLQADGPAHRHLIRTGTSTSGLITRETIHENVRRHGGSLDTGIYDLKIENSGQLVIGCGGATELVCQFHNRGVLVIRSQVTIDGDSNTTAINVPGVAESFQPREELGGGTQSFSGDGTTTTFSVAHGLASAPTVRNVWAESADAAGNKYVSNVDTTNIDVTFAAAPASGTGNIVLGFDARV